LKKLDAILFDLDGTLLPMDYDSFLHTYFSLLAEETAPYGVDHKVLVDRIWKGTKEMVLNDGTCSNEDRFWNSFGPFINDKMPDAKAKLDIFYVNRFKAAKEKTGDNPLARQVIESAHQKAEKVVLATNPLFPVNAIVTRLSWIGLSLSDFDLITTYETSHYCKPNPAYYTEIMEKIGASPEACMMVGNDVQEDMEPSVKLKMQHYLIRDCLLTHGLDDSSYFGGTFADFAEFIKTI